MIAALSLSALSGCGKKAGTPEVVKTEGEGAPGELPSHNQQYEVKLEERSASQQHQYNDNDLCFVDAVSGKTIRLGMSQKEVEEISGAPLQKSTNHCVYDGLIVLYDSNQTAISLLVSDGVFGEDKKQSTRYTTNRGVKLGTPLADFQKAYGEEYNKVEPQKDDKGEIVKTPSNAVRYFSLDGDKSEYLGDGVLDAQQKAQYGDKLYLQQFTFDPETETVMSMSIMKADSLGK